MAAVGRGAGPLPLCAPRMLSADASRRSARRCSSVEAAYRSRLVGAVPRQVLRTCRERLAIFRGMSGATMVVRALLVLTTISGCSAGAGGSSNDPASLLAERDGSTDIGAYSAALDAWQAKCSEGRVVDAGYVD